MAVAVNSSCGNLQNGNSQDEMKVYAHVVVNYVRYGEEQERERDRYCLMRVRQAKGTVQLLARISNSYCMEI